MALPGNLRIFAAVCLLSWGTTACVTVEEEQTTADGQKIPAKKFPHLTEYEHVCELTLGKNYDALEQLLDRYGRNGWKLAGFLNKDGDTYAFCMVR